jgi:MFS family permease
MQPKICQAIAPAIVASISDTGGRRLSFIICFTIFFCANIGLALQTSYPALLILRMVQASGSSSAIALSVATVADIATSAQRGKYNGYATAGILFGPAFGPTIGGLLAQYLGWRAIFWFLAIFSFCFLLIFIFIFPETCRNVVGNGSVRPRGISMSILGYFQFRKAGNSEHVEGPVVQSRKLKFPNPWHTLKILGDKESALLLGYNALAFSAQMLLTGRIIVPKSYR